MARNYTARGRYYDVQGKQGRVQRPTKLAAGMTYTRQRSRHGGELSQPDDCLRLSVRGTLAKTSDIGYLREAVRKPCPCCKQSVTTWRINDAGRRRLHHYRLARAKRAGVITIDHPNI